MGTYRSALREDQVELTRDRILDATIEVMSRGVTELSIPAVAKEAGVSVPTIYRHFKNKRGLVSAIADRVQRSVSPKHPQADTPEELAACVRPAYEHHDALPEVVRAAARSELRRRLERGTEGQKQRAAWIRRAFAPVTRNLPKREREHLLRMVHVLCSSSTLRAFEDHFGDAPTEAADTVAWTIRALAAHAEGRTK